MNWADFIVRSTLVLAAGFAASLAFTRASAALRHFIWTAAFLSLLALPVALRLAPKIALGSWEPAPVVRPVTVTSVLVPTPIATVAAAPTGRPLPDGRGSVWALYFAGLLVVAARFVAGAVRTSRIVRQSTAADYAQHLTDEIRRELNIDRPVRALEGPGATVPMTWGTRRPVVILPSAARQWSAERLHAVVFHELVHVQRNDLLAQMAAQAACCLYFFHPLVWLAARQLRKERERACDNVVVAAGVPAPDYAGHLLEMARSLVERRSLADAPAMAETGDLEDRVRAVLDRGSNRAPLNRRMAATVAALACALVLPVALVTLHAQPATGALAGVVQDVSKARVPGCYVRIKNLDGKNEEAIQVNMAGEFGFAAIPVGRYAVEVRAPGFVMGKTEVLVEAGRRNETMVVLEVGKISESVTVRGSRPATGSLAPTSTARAAAPSGGTPLRIPIGGNVQAARLVRQPRPEYPADLKAQGITGTVMLRAVISTTGEPMNIEVVNTTVNHGLAQAALDSVRQWRYQPTLLNGQPVEVVTSIEVNFELDQ